ncbi:MAG: hypothetical protein EPO21_15970 [Chloroflexota bacterium]|nr:MAG: hypothetical protein EPO21_15970 [Chloroflexota bacterium]
MDLYSVTITPPRSCQKILRQLVLRLPEPEEPPISRRLQPHVTLHMIYGVEDVTVVEDLLREVCGRTAPLTIRVTTTPSFLPRTDAEAMSLAVDIEKTPELEDLYMRLQSALSSAGLRSYTFTPEQWLPHLTLLYLTELPSRELIATVSSLLASLRPCSFLTRSLELNRLDENERWVELRSFPLMG